MAEKRLVWFLPTTLISKHLAKMTTLKTDVKKASWHHARESSYTSRVRWHFLAPVSGVEIPVRYARKAELNPPKSSSTLTSDISVEYGLFRNWGVLSFLSTTSTLMSVWRVIVDPPWKENLTITDKQEVYQRLIFFNFSMIRYVVGIHSLRWNRQGGYLMIIEG